jgi:hypothetical protein
MCTEHQQHQGTRQIYFKENITANRKLGKKKKNKRARGNPHQVINKYIRLQ